MENNKKPTPVEWFAEEMFKQGYFNDKQLTISNIKHFVKQAKGIEEAKIRYAVRIGAGSLGQWTPELEEAILAEFKK